VGTTRKNRGGGVRALLSSAAALALLATACGSDTSATQTEAAGATEAGETPDATGSDLAFPEDDITWVVPYTPGGGFDTYSRGVAKVMEEVALPSGVNVPVSNITPIQEGIMSMYTADPNGYGIGILPMPAAAAQEIQFPEVSQWETDKFTILGSVDENAYVVYVPSDSPFETIDDLMAAGGLKALTVEKGSSSSLASLAAIAGLGLEGELLYGAEGSQEVATAAIRGDVDFFVYGTTDVIGFVESGDVRPLLFLGTPEQRPESLEWLADVPSAGDVGYPELEGAVTELRAIVGPPDMPEEVATYLSDAIWRTMQSDEFKAWAEEAGRPIVPRNAVSAKEAVDKQIAAMKELIPRLLEASGGEF
jgi:tripartite-type tricarboxylate transporter receptor subunit TctC